VKRSISLSPQADRDIDELFSYLAQDSLDAAVRFLTGVQEAFELLSAMPEIGSLQHFDNPALRGLRAWPVKDFEKHLIFYRVTPRRIEIIRVLHASRDLEDLFEE